MTEFIESLKELLKKEDLSQETKDEIKKMIENEAQRLQGLANEMNKILK